MGWPIPCQRQGGRLARARARRPGTNTAPEMPSSTKLRADSQVFLGSLTVDIRQEGCSQRSAPQRRHTAHLRWHPCCTPGKPSSRDQGGDKTHCAAGRVHSPSTWSPVLLRPGKSTKCRPKSLPLWSTQEPEPEPLRPGKCTQHMAGLRQFPAEHLEPEQCRLGKHTCREQVQTQCGPDTVSTPHTCQ